MSNLQITRFGRNEPNGTRVPVIDTTTHIEPAISQWPTA